jgi:penicillin amidase
MTAAELRDKARTVLARLEGEIVVPGLRERVEVLRDHWGVPHIYAKNQDDLFFAQGFVCAQDRLFQMDLWRRLARGETAELLGKERLEGDRLARLLRFRGDLNAEWNSYGRDAKEIATAFTRGINACIDHMGDRLPIEFLLLNTRPGRWEPEDILGRMSGIIMTRNFRQEVERAQLIAAVGLEKARRIAPTDPPRDFAPVPGLDLAGIDKSVLASYDAATKPLRFSLGSDGSNNWVVAGAGSTSGKPLLASDPHRGIALPALRYLVHLHAPGWNVIGSGEPELPGVALGHNEHLAWGFTIVGTDQADLYVEETHPDDPTRYRAGERWESMHIVREKVRVRRETKPVEIELRFTRHGPVLHQDVKRHRAYALRWIGAEPGGAGYLGCLALDRARSDKEFRAAIARWKSPSENIVYADVEGNIGWVAAGWAPVRKGWDGLLPVPGAAGRYEWQGFLDAKDLPQALNPASGYLATANHNILPAHYDHAIGYEWAPSFRIRRVRQVLEGKERFSLGNFRKLQHDTLTLPGQALARLIRTVGVDDPALKPYAELLSSWAGVLSEDSRAGALYAAWLRELTDGFFRLQVPKELVSLAVSNRGLDLMLDALANPDVFWFGPKPSARRDELVRRTFATAIKKLQKLAPKGDLSRLTWGQLHKAFFRHPLSSLGPAYTAAFDLAPVPRPGDVNTVNNTRHDESWRQVHGASYRHLFDLSD